MSDSPDQGGDARGESLDELFSFSGDDHGDANGAAFGEELLEIDAIPAEGKPPAYITVLRAVVASVAVAMSAYHVYAIIFGTPPALLFRALHVGFVVPLVFLTFSRRSKRGGPPSVLDLMLAASALVPIVYLWIAYSDIQTRFIYVTPIKTIEFFLGTLLLLLILEGARRTVGIALPLVAVCALLYGLYGSALPGRLGHPGLSFGRVIEQLYLLTEGFFGGPTAVSARYLVIFILFGAFLQQAGAGSFFTDLASSLVGKYQGGVAKASVVSSSLFGTISGTSIANVAVTGTFTIPAMIKAGFKKNVAGAIEAISSSGGSLMPPIMGAAAFLVVEFTGVPYGDVVRHAALPAILYYISIFTFVHYESVKSGVSGRLEGAPRALHVMRDMGHVVFVPLGVMVYMILTGYTPPYAAWVSLVLIIVFSHLRWSRRMGPRKIILALRDGGLQVVPVAMACACAGIVSGMVLVTGAGIRLSQALLATFGQSTMALLLVTMVVSILLGMGMPSPAAYVIVASLLAPALVQAGVPVIAAHLFVFYFAILSAITPPVALASFTATSISGGNPMVTSVYSLRFGIVSFLIPYIFAYNQELLLIGDPVRIVAAAITGAIGVMGIAVGMQGYFRGRINWLQRATVLAGSVLLVIPGWQSAIGAALLAASIVVQHLRVRGQRRLEVGSEVSATEGSTDS